MANLLPFNLEKALAGAKVFSRQGAAVTGITDMRPFGATGNSSIAFLSLGEVRAVDADGLFFPDKRESCCDIFMAAPEPERKVWYSVIWKDGQGVGFSVDDYESAAAGDYDVLAITSEFSEGSWRFVSAEVIYA